MTDNSENEALVIDQIPESTKDLAQAPTQPSSIMQAVMNAAADPTIDIDRVDRLLVIHNQIMAQEAEKAYAGAMSRVQASIGPIIKNKENTHTTSHYANLAAINLILIPVYTDEGFALSFSNRPSDKPNHIIIMCDVMHADGHTKHYEYDLPFDGVGTQGNATKTAIHASASSVSYGQRYLTTMIFNIATFDDDGNAAGTQQQVQGITTETLDKIQARLDITGKTIEDCLKYINELYAADHARLTQFSEIEGQRMIHKLSKCADGGQE